MQTDKRIQRLIEVTLKHLLNQLRTGNDGELYLVDHNDQCEISAHYGVSHLAASLLVLGKKLPQYYTLGQKLLSDILSRYPKDHKLAAYHYDFNNFAFVICYDNLKESDTALRIRVKNMVLNSPDSNHNTVNWLPMRLFVNYRRKIWTGNERYQKVVNKCLNYIYEATNDDGGIEDRLPKGLSFNLQYDISALAILCFAKETIPEYDFNQGLAFLLSNVAPDGDINYQGRGINQVFAWGPWIYLLSAFNLSDELDKALDFLEPRLIKMLSNSNMMLNEWNGSEKYLWWDYHYESVYSSHILFWLTLALTKTNKLRYEPPKLISKRITSTGLHVFKAINYFISLFEGRTEYLVENGPIVNLIWTKRDQTIFKGPLGPWRGLFGNNNTYEDAVMLNFMGPVSVYTHPQNSLLQRVCSRTKIFKVKARQYSKKPVFCPITINEIEGCVTICWDSGDSKTKFFNFPSFCNIEDINLIVDGKDVPLTLIARVRNQYDWVNISQSKVIEGRIWELKIKL